MLSQILSSLSSSLFSCLAFLSCLVFSFSLCFCLRVVSLWSWCVFGVCGVAWLGLAWLVVRHGEKHVKTPVCTFKTSPCVRSKRPRVYRHQAHQARMYEKCGLGALGAGTHADVLNVHTETRSMQTPVPPPPPQHAHRPQAPLLMVPFRQCLQVLTQRPHSSHNTKNFDFSQGVVIVIKLTTTQTTKNPAPQHFESRKSSSQRERHIH